MKLNVLLYFFLFFLFFFSIEISSILWSSDYSTQFTVSSQTFSCSDDGKFWQTYSDGRLQAESSLDNCYNPEGSGRETTCCPSGQGCNLTTNKCESTEYPIRFCGDYKDKESCERYNHNLGEISVESSVNDERFCGSNQVVNSTCTEAITNCRCAWDDGECNAVYDSELFCIGGGSNPEDPNSKKKGNCSFSSRIENRCDTIGLYNVFTTAVWNGDSVAYGFDKCNDSSFSIGCYDYVRIPFFSSLSIFVSLSLIFVFYVVFYVNIKN